MAVTSGAQVWTPFKELYHTVQYAIQHRQQDAIQDLEMALRRHRTEFIALLQNPAPNPTHREAVKRADQQGLTMQGQQGLQFLTPQFIQEALIISNLFSLNEFAAVELLLAGENQQSYFPGLPRGLVAVLLYYDGRVSMVNSLRSLLQAREGRTWTLGLGDELVSIATRFTDQLLGENLVERILILLKNINIQEEMEKLQKEKALGTAKHRKQVLDMLTEIRTSLAECLFCLACQRPLCRADTLSLLRHLQNHCDFTADGKLDTCTLTLLMALLYCFDVRILDQEDAEEIIQKLPIVVDDTFVPDIHRELISNNTWVCPGLKSCATFAWGLTLRALSQYPSIQGLAEYCEQDEILIDTSLKGDFFLFLHEKVVSTDNFHQEEFFLRQVHNILADLVVQMPLKVKELRNRGDETARIILAHQHEGVEPPAGLPQDFEQLLNLYSALYRKDPLGLELALEYWCQPESLAGAGTTGFTMTYQYRPPHRQLSLHKFVRHAGDLLPPSLYVPYIRMLCGLSTGPQCAHHCFNLLKTNGMLAGGQVSSVSWEHFFMSMNQYYVSLRQEAPMAADVSSHATYRHHMRSITPQEVEGLSAVLKLIRTIIEQDPSARVALYENPTWVPIVLLLGLVSCGMPPVLKAELLLTLAAFARTPEIAANIWQALETAQILPTVPGTAVATQGGLQVELDEVESRNEEFPMTRAFLTLVDALTDVSIPAGLGAGYRAPGFDPYLKFIRDSVFLNFNTRAYKTPAEKWQVASGALDLFHKLVWQHQVAPEDFLEQMMELQGGGTVMANKPPGHSLLIHLLNDTRLLKMILHILHEGTCQLDKYIPLPGQPSLEKAVLLCLKLVHATLVRQDEFLSRLRESGTGELVTSIDRLLLGVNPATGRPDHIVNITKYVTYNVSLPEHALYAVKILGYVSQSPLAIPELVGLFTAGKTVSRDILHGFVECLEAEDTEDQAQEDQPDDEWSQSAVRSATRQGIIQVLLQTLDQPAPNVAHFLLGYELRKPVKQTELQDPGVLGSPRTCLHSVLTLLDKGLTSGGTPSCLIEMPQLASLAYQLIYTLCANKDTAAPTMRYLRTAHDFLYRHLRCLPFPLPETDVKHRNLMLSSQSWLLKSVAVELRLTSASRQRSHTQRLLSVLLEDSSIAQNKVLQTEGLYDPDYVPYDVELSLYGNQSTMNPTLTGGVQCQRKLLQLLEAVTFQEAQPPALELDFIKLSDLEPVVQSCQQRSLQGVAKCNVQLLHRVLLQELNSPQAMTASGQRTHILQEIDTICAHMVAGNSVRESVYVKRAALEGWRQVVEVMLTACPEDLLPGDTRHNVILELLQRLLTKVAEEDALPELTSAVSGVLLTLMCHLAHCFSETPADKTMLQNISNYTMLLEDSASCAAVHHNVTMETGSGRRTLLSSSLQVVLKGLLEHIQRSSGSTQRVMANLYGAFLYFLQIAQKPQTQDVFDTDTESGEKSVGASIMNRDSEYERLASENLATISSYGENLMEVVCRYACDGHDVGRMLAFASLNSVLSLDKSGQWLGFMTSKGYVEHFVKSLQQDDVHLQAMLSPQPEPLKALYIYEAKMSLLTRIAQTPAGAQILLQSGVMQRLAECTVYDLRPDIHMERPDESSFIPTVMQRYRQVLFPALKLCLAVLTGLGIENSTANNQVLQFLISHIDVVMMVLRDRHSTPNLPALQELALMTAVVARAAIDSGEDALVLGDTAGIEFRGHVARLQRQMLALLPRYSFSQQLQKQISSLDMGKPGAESHTPLRDTQMGVWLAVGEVACNVTAFCTHILAKSASSAQYSRLLFNPSLVESANRDLQALEDVSSVGVATNRSPNLGVVVYMLRQCTLLFISAHDTHKQYLRKLDTLTTLSSEELSELSGVPTSQKLSSQKKHQLARQRLVHQLCDQSQQLRQLAYIIENCLFLLWRHLDFYLIHCEPADTSTSLFKLHSQNTSSMRRLNDLGMGGNFPAVDTTVSDVDTELLGRSVSREELQQLKTDAVTYINESLLKKLHEIDQCYMKGRSRYAFMGALIRRLKRFLIMQAGASS